MIRWAYAAALLAGLALAGPAAAAKTQPQVFFADKLLTDRHTSRSIKELLRSGAGFVDRAVRFRDVTGDERDDAIVRVQSGGAAGAVAVYVFSTDTGEPEAELTMVFRSQRLLRVRTSVRDGVLSYRSARPRQGDEPCCPSRLVESTTAWDAQEHRLHVADRREITP
jgi:hypothetical protein